MPSYIQILCMGLCLKTCWDSWKVNIRILQCCLTITDILTTICCLDMWLECHKHILITTDTKYLHVHICEPRICYRMETILSAESRELYLWLPQLVCHPLPNSSLLEVCCLALQAVFSLVHAFSLMPVKLKVFLVFSFISCSSVFYFETRQSFATAKANTMLMSKSWNSPSPDLRWGSISWR